MSGLPRYQNWDPIASELAEECEARRWADHGILRQRAAQYRPVCNSSDQRNRDGEPGQFQRMTSRMPSVFPSSHLPFDQHLKDAFNPKCQTEPIV